MVAEVAQAFNGKGVRVEPCIAVNYAQVRFNGINDPLDLLIGHPHCFLCFEGLVEAAGAYLDYLVRVWRGLVKIPSLAICEVLHVWG